MQKLEITLQDILRNQFASVRNEGWEQNDTIALHFDPLRSSMKRAIRRDLFHMGVLEDNDDSA